MSAPNRGGLERCEKVVVGNSSIEITIKDVESHEAGVINIPWAAAPHYRKREVIVEPGQAAIRPIGAEARSRLIDGIAKARLWLDEIISGKIDGTDAIARREGRSERSVRMTLNLAFLAPQIVKAAETGTLPHGFGLMHMTDLPVAWIDQRRLISRSL
jgi:hypothetical protein